MKKFINSLSLASGTLLASAQTVLAQAPSNVGTISPGGQYFLSVGSLINAVLRIVMAVGALLVFFYLIWGGIEWITSGGDKAKTEGARNKITAAVIGLIILAASYAIFILIINFFGYSNFEAVFTTGFSTGTGQQ